MSNKEEIRTDIRNCFKVCDALDKKYDERCRELQDNISGLTVDLKLTISSVTTLAKSMEQFSLNFDKHNDEEIKRYDEMKMQQSKFIRYFWVATGSVSTIIAIGSLFAWLVGIILDLQGIKIK